jgi:hypothetical protein
LHFLVHWDSSAAQFSVHNPPTAAE